MELTVYALRKEGFVDHQMKVLYNVILRIGRNNTYPVTAA